MPNIKSAKKRVLIAQRQSLRNTSLRSSLRTTIRKFDASHSAQDVDQARTNLFNATRALDKAVTKGILHKNAAARKKSRLTKRLNKIVNA